MRRADGLTAYTEWSGMDDDAKAFAGGCEHHLIKSRGEVKRNTTCYA
jgi:hypothetical protein